MITETSLARVALAISAFRSDAAVLELLQRAFAPGSPRFGAIIVVDSLGSGAIANVIAERGWPVRYVNADRNLGSAGNLDLRLRLAAESGLDWCLALNHDGELDSHKAIALVACGTAHDKVGAVYPQLRLTSAGGRFDRPRRDFGALSILQDTKASTTPIPVKWSTSNGALYRLDAIRDGVSAWPQLWMGYEDLALGWELHRRGWKQLISPAVTVDDNYEFRAFHIAGRTVHIADKPAWYSYYQLRNLALIARNTGGDAVSWFALAKRASIDFALLAVRSDRLRRARLLLKGLVDGLRGRSGKGPVP